MNTLIKIATGLLLGFGIADFDEKYLERHLVTTFEPSIERDTREWAYLEAALVVRKPASRHR